MNRSLIAIVIRHEQDVVATRQRAKQIASLAGFDGQDQTRFATAVSEIARNAFRYAGGGKAVFCFEENGRLLMVRISDTGPGIPHLQSVLSGKYDSKTGMGLGIVGAQRLSDRFEIDAASGAGTTITLGKYIPHGRALSQMDVGSISESLARLAPLSAYDEVQQQNQELLRTLDLLRIRQSEVEQLNRDLHDTNRGILALNAELDDKASALKIASELKTKFLSQMTHELRTPLNSIVMLSRMLVDGIDGPLNEEQARQAGFMRKSSESLLEMVNDLLDLAKIEAGKTEIRTTEFSIPSLFSGLRGMFRPVMQYHPDIALIIEPPANDFPLAITDEGKLAQILRNLVSNAIKFTGKGRIRVWTELRPSDYVAFSVSDTGPGISPDDQNRLFQDFTQLDSVAKKGFKGTGLGLSLSRQFATLLGGELNVFSEMGKGSVFELQIPLRIPTTLSPQTTAEGVRHGE